MLTQIFAAAALLQGGLEASSATDPPVRVTFAASSSTYAAGAALGSLAVPDADPGPGAIDHSDFYYTRVSIHRTASYATLPLFVLEFVAGEQLLAKGSAAPGWARTVHKPAAISLEVLFGVNTVTGLWNLWDGRREPEGRTRRTIHAVTMLLADAGFAWAASLAPDREAIDARIQNGGTGWTPHKKVAVVSMAVATAGYLLMLPWKGRDQ